MESSDVQRDHHPAVQEFITWITENSIPGIKRSQSANTCLFIPLPRLKAYLDGRRVTALLQALFPDGTPVRWDAVRTDYSRVFCILILIGKGIYIKHFTQNDSLSDQKLPFESKPRSFPTATYDPNFFSTFSKKQWMFCPHEFHYNKIDLRVENECILPFISRKKLAEGGSAEIYKIDVHEAYDNLNPLENKVCNSSIPAHHTYALKTYRTQEAEKYYKAEVGAFRKLTPLGKPLPNLIEFYGSYVLDGTYNVILEYADQGNLEDYFKNTAPPSRGKDITQFWRGLFGVIRALDKIHELPPSETGDLHYLQGWHQDVKPSNILVCSGDSKSPYGYRFKLGDLGLSHFKMNVTPRKGPVTDADSYGTRAYGAPECYRWDPHTERARLDVEPSIDIWSLGCVFSEAAVWVVSGMDGLQRYRLQREEETKCLGDFKDGDCFHNGEDTLNAVESMHISLREDTRSSDHVTDAVWNSMIKEMLEMSDRPSTKQLLLKSRRILRDAEAKLSSAITRSSPSALRPRTPPEPPTPLEVALNHTPQHGHSTRWIPRSHSQRSPQFVPNGPAPATTYDETTTADESNKNMLPKLVDSSTTHARRYNEASGYIEPWRYDGTLSTAQQKRRAEGGYNDFHYSQPSPDTTNSRSDRSEAYSKAISSLSPSYSPTETTTAPDVNSRHIAKKDNQYSHDYRNAVRASSSNSLSSPIVRPQNDNSPDIFLATAGEDKGLAIEPHDPFKQEYQHNMAERWNTLPLSPTIEPSNKLPLLFLSVADTRQKRRDRKEHGKHSLFAHHGLDVQLRSRDHAFLVDDSESMNEHWPDVLDLFSNMAYMVKGFGRDGIELHFSRSLDHYREKHTTPLLAKLRDRKPSGFSDIKPRLNSILWDYQKKINSKPFLGMRHLSKPVRPLNLYIFTDGAWQDDVNVERPIRNLVEVEKLKLPGDQVGIQFIRFGNDMNGKRRLEFLDSGLNLSLDIVDTEPWNGNVYKMLLGSVNKRFDDDRNPGVNGVTRSANLQSRELPNGVDRYL